MKQGEEAPRTFAAVSVQHKSSFFSQETFSAVGYDVEFVWKVC